MGVASGAVGRWTRAFVLASLVGFLLLGGLVTVGAGRQAVAVVGVFGFVLPMVFGMAYVLLPPYVGRTFGISWLPGLHFAATVIGGLGLGWALLLDGPWMAAQAGLASWSIGILCFAGGLAWTVVPAIREDPAGVFRLGDRPQRSTRLATAMLPLGVSVLLVGTGWLAASALDRTAFLATTSRATHLMLAGFAALLVFALGARLLRGFFHVDPPRWLAWATLGPAAVGPVLLAGHSIGSNLFLVGGLLEAAAMVAYLALVGFVAMRAETARVGLYGILLGAVAGAGGVLVAFLAVTGVISTRFLDLHAVLLLQGFFGLTIVGYAFQFFPVTAGRYWGASRRGALTVIGLLAAGDGVYALGTLTGSGIVVRVGGYLALAGAAGYCWLLGRRLLADSGA